MTAEFTRDEIERLTEAVNYAFRMEAQLEQHSRRAFDKRYHREEAQAWRDLEAHVASLPWKTEDVS